ncbi:MAG: hypothetical protein H0U75_03465 [Legionella sp.]|nr:hypothetical protein [Legionella sp.]
MSESKSERLQATSRPPNQMATLFKIQLMSTVIDQPGHPVEVKNSQLFPIFESNESNSDMSLEETSPIAPLSTDIKASQKSNTKTAILTKYHAHYSNMMKLTVWEKSPSEIMAVKKQEYQFGAHVGEFFLHEYDSFVREVNGDIDLLNEEIIKFNALIEDREQLEQLGMIFKAQRFILKRHSDELIRYCPGFKIKFQEGIFNQIQTQAVRLGISSMTYFEDKEHYPVNHSDIIGLYKELLADMHPKKVEKLLQILIKANTLLAYNKRNPNTFKVYDQLKASVEQTTHDDFQKLYAPEDPGYEQFRKVLLISNPIVFLGGGNSLNFSVSSKDNSSTFVLKVENRRGNPSDTEDFLRKRSTFRHIFAPIFAERQATSVVEGQLITRTLMITEFYPSGSLFDIMADNSKYRLFQAAADVFIQMGTIFELLSQANHAHLDPKLENFLVSGGSLCLGDAKGILPLTDQDVNQRYLCNNWYRLLTTSFMDPPEIRNDSFNADQAASYMFGKNLYHFLSQCSTGYLTNKHDGKQFDFSDPLFKTPSGKIFEYLIKELVKPKDRLTIKEALIVLKDMNFELTQAKYRCWNLLDSLKEVEPKISKNFELYNVSIEKATIETIQSLETEFEQFQDNQQKNLIEGRDLCRNFLNTVYKDPGDLNYILYRELIDKANFENFDDIMRRLVVVKTKLEISLKESKINCHMYLADIAATAIAPADKEMEQFIQYFSDRIEKATNQNVESIKKDLQLIHNNLFQLFKQLEKVCARQDNVDWAMELSSKMSTMQVEDRNISATNILMNQLSSSFSSKSVSRPGTVPPANTGTKASVVNGLFKPKPELISTERAPTFRY